MDYDKLRKEEVIVELKKHGIKGYSGLKKQEMINLLESKSEYELPIQLKISNIKKLDEYGKYWETTDIIKDKLKKGESVYSYDIEIKVNSNLYKKETDGRIIAKNPKEVRDKVKNITFIETRSEKTLY